MISFRLSKIVVPVMILGATAGCGRSSRSSEVAVLARGGVPANVQCDRVPGTRTTVCGVQLDSVQVAEVAQRFALQPLPPDSSGLLNTVAESDATPAVCRSAFEQARVNGGGVRAVFGQPASLFEKEGAVQFEHLLVVPAASGWTCFVLEFAYG